MSCARLSPSSYHHPFPSPSRTPFLALSRTEKVSVSELTVAHTASAWEASEWARRFWESDGGYEPYAPTALTLASRAPAGSWVCSFIVSLG
mmetsp:Transcript_29453/g.90292  ORF Transcript_29453/g.90292 Transcript_29453/m.90292 type:complete len:91 (+) Transcript_29453:1182-1454(+)|eukprot:scaffold57770_cov28-Tisochrysis_lutea.AAC.4